MSGDFRWLCGQQDTKLHAEVGLARAVDLLASLPDHLAYPWAYGGAGDTFERRKEILDLIDERAKALDQGAEAYLAEQELARP